MNNKGKKKTTYLLLISITIVLFIITCFGIYRYKRMKESLWFWATTGIASNMDIVAVKNGTLYVGPIIDSSLALRSDLNDVETMIERIKNAKHKRYFRIQCTDDEIATRLMSIALFDLAKIYLSTDLIIVEECNFDSGAKTP